MERMLPGNMERNCILCTEWHYLLRRAGEGLRRKSAISIKMQNLYLIERCMLWEGYVITPGDRRSSCPRFPREQRVTPHNPCTGFPSPSSDLSTLSLNKWFPLSWISRPCCNKWPNVIPGEATWRMPRPPLHRRWNLTLITFRSFCMT